MSFKINCFLKMPFKINFSSKMSFKINYFRKTRQGCRYIAPRLRQSKNRRIRRCMSHFWKFFKKVTFLKFSMEKIKIVKMAKKSKIAINLIKKLEKICFFLINDQDFSWLFRNALLNGHFENCQKCVIFWSFLLLIK